MRHWGMVAAALSMRAKEAKMPLMNDNWQYRLAIRRTCVRTKVDRFGRIVVPKEIRDRHGLVEKQGILVFSGRATGELDSAVRSHREERLRKGGGLAR